MNSIKWIENKMPRTEDKELEIMALCNVKAARETPGGVIVQDTAWDGYEEIPAWIMQGYGTMALEADRQFEEAANQTRQTASTNRPAPETAASA